MNDNTAEGLILYSWDDTLEDYKDQIEKNPDLKIPQPEKSNIVRFKERDFSAYKENEIEMEFDREEGTILSGPLAISFDEDTGTMEKGDRALLLYIKDIAVFSPEKTKHEIRISLEEEKVYIDGSNLLKEDYHLDIKNENIPSRLIAEMEGTHQRALITELTYREAKYYGSVKNHIAAEYKKEGELLQLNDFTLFKDLDVSLESDQGSGNLSDPSPYITTKTAAGITVSSLKLSGDVEFQNTETESSVTEAGHSIKTDPELFLFKIINAEDTYRYNKASKEVRKENNFGINFAPFSFPFKTELKTNATDSLYHQRQKAEITATYKQNFQTFELGLDTKLALSQKLDNEFSEKNFEEEFWSYTEGWNKISELEFSTGKEKADSRSTLWSSNFSGAVALPDSEITIKPKLTYELSDTYRIAAKEELTHIADKEFLELNLPFSTDKKTISFDISRTGGGRQYTTPGGNYATDFDKLFQVQNERSWFYTSIPFYELFDGELKSKVTHNYEAKYEGNFRRTLYNSKKDLFIPSALTLALAREVSSQKPETDLYQVKAVISNNSINNFGSNSADKHFGWFSQEELATSLTTLFKIPREEPDNFKVTVQAFAQLLLFITEKSIITEQFDITYETIADWSIRDTLSYTRPSQTSLLSGLVHLIIPAAKDSQFSISRKDSLSIELARSNALMQRKYSYSHNVGIDFLEYYNVNAGLGGSLLMNQEKADCLSLEFTLGAKAEF